MDLHGLGLVVIRALRICPFGHGRLRVEAQVGEDGALGLRRGIVEHPIMNLGIAGTMVLPSSRETLVRVLMVFNAMAVVAMAILRAIVPIIARIGIVV